VPGPAVVTLLPAADALRLSQCIRQAPDRFAPIDFLEPYAEEIFFTGEVLSVGTLHAPADLHDAMSSPEADLWQTAMAEEQASCIGKKVYTSVPTAEIPLNAVLVGTKWVLTFKLRTNGCNEGYKACLVAHGFSEVWGRLL
jgi:hypothetical protein